MQEQSTDRTRQGICGICSAGCWVRVTYDDIGRIVSVKPDESSPYGMLCRAGQAAPDVIYSPHRLKFPMRRKGSKGTFDFERISWDDAYSIITENLLRIKEESGPEATAVYTGSGSFELALCDVFQPKGHDCPPCNHGAYVHQYLHRYRKCGADPGLGEEPCSPCTANRFHPYPAGPQPRSKDCCYRSTLHTACKIPRCRVDTD